jgi:predicted phage terminase large subunit-like protein
MQCFWPLVSPHAFSPNWHIELLCNELEVLAQRVANKEQKEYDLIINVPPGSTKTITCSIMFPTWCWTKWYWMRFITASYSATLSLESADYCREIIRSSQFQQLYPDISIKEDKDVKSNYRIVKKVFNSATRGTPQTLIGGSRYSTSVGGTLTGFHGDILIVDDPLNPTQAASETELQNANHWCEQTLSTRKTDKSITPTVIIMQRLHQDDPSGHMLAKMKDNVRHVCLPGEARNYRKQVKPEELYKYYVNDLLDPKRMPWRVLTDMEADLGQYGYAGQIGQDPTPPGGGMFKVDHLTQMEVMPPLNHIVQTIRYWDKAATKEKVNVKKRQGAYTAGVKISLLFNGRWIISDVKRGRWDSHERERIIKETAITDGVGVIVWVEQEPGSGGKDSAQGTILNLAGFKVYAETASGDKGDRADPFSVQVNNGNVSLLTATWNHDFKEEMRFFPFGTYKDQVDAGSGAFNKLAHKRIAGRVT